MSTQASEQPHSYAPAGPSDTPSEVVSPKPSSTSDTGTVTKHKTVPTPRIADPWDQAKALLARASFEYANGQDLEAPWYGFYSFAFQSLSRVEDLSFTKKDKSSLNYRAGTMLFPQDPVSAVSAEANDYEADPDDEERFRFGYGRDGDGGESDGDNYTDGDGDGDNYSDGDGDGDGDGDNDSDDDDRSDDIDPHELFAHARRDSSSPTPGASTADLDQHQLSVAASPEPSPVSETSRAERSLEDTSHFREASMPPREYRKRRAICIPDFCRRRTYIDPQTSQILASRVDMLVENKGNGWYRKADRRRAFYTVYRQLVAQAAHVFQNDPKLQVLGAVSAVGPRCAYAEIWRRDASRINIFHRNRDATYEPTERSQSSTPHQGPDASSKVSTSTRSLPKTPLQRTNSRAVNAPSPESPLWHLEQRINFTADFSAKQRQWVAALNVRMDELDYLQAGKYLCNQ
ncbi:hypothetical protein CC1G_09262 [Coprinopsis cinerea okayama7|uniref:Uncharacterized protein n=1 Tax=Coprinopsis cinerea (strain Okayama-7 / 130 / ATCC MYA-4618 / FGSC 9003) TaxID=240176 RepID=A8N841_COPC7|nr:hypothetical protein CC1G_09262 [Coprinopsis cinerea okayama7\|eukprot:XP_001830997.2 hypothetical protein CC1G_09262 [Coprinopsis cinerea okayama7\